MSATGGRFEALAMAVLEAVPRATVSVDVEASECGLCSCRSRTGRGS
jgi:hypothetical protein